MNKIIEHAIEMIITYDRKGKITACNRAASEELGYEEDICGLPLASVFVHGAENGQKDIFSIISDQTESTDMLAYRKNGTCFPVFLRLFPDYLVAQNMTLFKNMEKEVALLKAETEEMRRVRNEFIANMTHELRTPINGIKGHASAMLTDEPTADQKKTLQIIQRCCDDMTAIINNILDFSKLQAGKFELHETRYDLYELLDYVIATNAAIINEKGLRVTLNIADNVPRHVTGDDLRLRQILNNLISNAVKFTDAGFIRVDVNKQMQYKEETELFFMVSDSGIGIAPEDRDRLFESFSQVDSSSTRKHGGTGLGLVITKELVELMGGDIRVDSQKGKGSNFSFVVRVKTAEAEEDVGSNTLLADAAERIFVVEEPQESVYRFGSAENVVEIQKKMQKLILALELEAWEKAENIASGLKRLLTEAPEDVRKLLFRLEMAVRKEDEGKSRERFAVLQEALGRWL